MEKVVFFEVTDRDKKYLQGIFRKDERFVGKVDVKFFEETLDNAFSKFDDLADTTIIATFIYSKVTAEVIDKFPLLKAIMTMSTGYDHIDKEYCKQKNISVHNVPAYGENTVAEHTFALILNLSRKICESNQRVKSLSFSPRGLEGFDLKGKTIGIVGMGRIGMHVARIAKGFDMNVVSYDPYPKREIGELIGFEFVDFEKLLKVSNIVSLHCVYNTATHHLINTENIRTFKKGSLLINTSRGGLVETKAILQGLDEGNLYGAGLDVLEEETNIKEERQLLTEDFDNKSSNLTAVLQGHLLIADPRVLVTPHNAFNSVEALQRIADTTLENIDGVIKSQLSNVVM
jgi:D-lactate dehydrogenase